MANEAEKAASEWLMFIRPQRSYTDKREINVCQ